MADGLANEIRIFDPDGTYLRTLGGEGGGPAEFRRLDRVDVVRGDILVGRDVSAFRPSISHRTEADTARCRDHP